MHFISVSRMNEASVFDESVDKLTFATVFMYGVLDLLPRRMMSVRKIFIVFDGVFQRKEATVFLPSVSNPQTKFIMINSNYYKIEDI